MPTTASLDPTFLALLSIFGGVVVTVVAGLVGALIQGRREHARWLRERRFEVYSGLYGFLQTDRLSNEEIDPARLSEVIAAAHLIGARRVRKTIAEIITGDGWAGLSDKQIEAWLIRLRDDMARDLAVRD